MDHALASLFSRFRAGEDCPPALVPPAEALALLADALGFSPTGLDDPRIAANPDAAVVANPPGETLKIEQARALSARAAQTPFGGWQLFVIEGLDRATPEASNHLLKLLEDRPARTFFAATAENPARVLPTLLSRMARFGFGAEAAGELPPEAARMVDDYLDGRTLELPRFILDRDSEISRQEAAAMVSYALARAGSHARAAEAVPALETALRRLGSSNASVRPLLDLAFLPFA